NLKVEQRSLTPSSNGEAKKIEVKKPPKVFVFFIGGAGDRRSFMGSGPNYNVQAVSDNFSSVFPKKLQVEWLSFHIMVIMKFMAKKK
ncbi:hypothetical protein, partial [Chromobacterium piscinae]|uniref:hypothetical protein n=1 Tax=Chromobacterium piscinae TaxID=686831 RepID=UPI00326062C2